MRKDAQNRHARVALWASSVAALVAALVCGSIWLSGRSDATPARSAATPAVSRDVNWDFEPYEELAPPAVAQGPSSEPLPEESPSEPAAEPPAIVDESGKTYAAQQVLLSFDGSISRERLTSLLKAEGVEVESVSLVSKSLEGNDVLVEVHYRGAEDPCAVVERLRDTDYVTSAGPNLIETLCEVEEGDVAVPVTTSAGGGELASQEDERPDPVQGIEAKPNDFNYNRQWGNEAIGASIAWDTIKANKNVTVVVLDSGVDTNHPDLKDNLVPSRYVKNTYSEKYGYHAVEDVRGHGTHVAGIIAAVADNEEGVAGVSYNARILPLKTTVDSSGNMYVSDIIEAIDYAISLKTNVNSPDYLKNIRVINLSFGGYSIDESGNYQQAIARATEAGILVVASAGNEAKGDPHYPSGYPHVISVSALRNKAGGPTFDDYYSNWCSTVDLAAPGTAIYSTVIGDSYGDKTGTSMAAPMVSGAASLVFAQTMSATPAAVEAILEQTAKDLGEEGRDDYYGHGMVRVDLAVSAQHVAKATIDPIPEQLWTGQPIRPSIVASYKGTALVEGEDYTLSYRDNQELGTATVTVTGAGNFIGTVDVTFQIVSKLTYDLSKVSFTGAQVTYDGEPHSIELSGTLPEGVTVAYENNGQIEIGTYEVTAHLTGDPITHHPIPDMTATLTIEPMLVELPTAQDGLTYTGQEQTGFVVGEDAPYQLSGVLAATDTGTYEVVAALKDTQHCLWDIEPQTSADQTLGWTIAPCGIGDALVADIDDQPYTGSAIEPQPAVTLDGRELVAGSDYELSYAGNVQPGTALLIVTGMGNYEDSTFATFQVVRVDLSSAEVAAIPDQPRTGTALQPVPQVTLGSRDLVPEVDFTLSYENNVEVGTATVTITGMGGYEGNVSATFQIVELAAVPVYRLYNHRTSEHLYTTVRDEYDALPAKTGGDWIQEDVAWLAPAEGAVGASPVWRLYNPASGDHHYTADEGERDALVAHHGWELEGMAFHSAAVGTPDTIGLYRLYNGRLQRGQHHYTADAAERDALVALYGWDYETVAFWGYEPPK